MSNIQMSVKIVHNHTIDPAAIATAFQMTF